MQFGHFDDEAKEYVVALLNERRELRIKLDNAELALDTQREEAKRAWAHVSSWSIYAVGLTATVVVACLMLLLWS